MARLRGRHDDMLIIRGVNVYPSEVEAVLVAQDDIAPFYQLILDRDGTLDTLEVQDEVTAPFVSASDDALEVGHPALGALHGRITDDLRSRLGLSVTVTLLPPNTLARIEVGKAVRVVDRRSEDRSQV